MTVITETLRLGQPCAFTATLKRKTQRTDQLSRSEKKTWEESQCTERKGIVVGTRTLWNGRYETEHDPTDGDISYFVFEEPVPAFLVAFALNRKPILVPQSATIAA